MKKVNLSKKHSVAHGIIGFLVDVKEADKAALRRKFPAVHEYALDYSMNMLLYKKIVTRTAAGTFVLNPEFVK
jgi:hypothetical protein